MKCSSPFLLKLENGDICEMPCGRCLHCKIQKSREWSMRLIHELKYYDSSSFITLTYNEEHLPDDLSLNKRDLQLFWKSLRKEIQPRKIKYFACGEYGEKYKRPHYHAILFGLSPKDKKIIDDCWKKGFTYVGTVTYDSCRYVCDYVLKKYNGEKEVEEYGDKQSPYKTCSQGLGLRFALDNRLSWREDPVTTVRGVPCGLPRYYRKKLEIEGLYDKSHSIETKLECIKYHTEHGAENLTDVYKKIHQSRVQADKELKAKMALKKRDLGGNG